MKKLLAFVLVVASVLSVVGCGSKVDPNKKSEGTLTYDEYIAAELETEVVIEAFVQASRAGGITRLPSIFRMVMAVTSHTMQLAPRLNTTSLRLEPRLRFPVPRPLGRDLWSLKRVLPSRLSRVIPM